MDSIRKLTQALQDLMANKFGDLHIDTHHVNNHEKSFKAIVGLAVKQAVSESHLAMEYASVFQQIAELFEPIVIPSNPERPVNKFRYLLTNELQIYVNNR